MTLEKQYEQYLKENPKTTYTYKEWMKLVFRPRLLKVLEKHLNNNKWKI